MVITIIIMFVISVSLFLVFVVIVRFTQTPLLPCYFNVQSIHFHARFRNADWGIRELDKVIDLATKANLKFHHMADMPANNKYVFFQKL
eukprot:m.108657 g.108657  ORF g.108657 m.108657 type:complete len:89 (+) comp22640_c0_seq7:106-372(+)